MFFEGDDGDKFVPHNLYYIFVFCNLINMKLYFKLLVSALLGSFFFINCSSRKVNILLSHSYDKKKDQTNYMIFPYGNATMPGEWEKGRFDASSKQQFFYNDDGVIISIVFAPCDGYEFNVDNSKKGNEFISALYEWDSKYLVKEHGLEREIIEEDKVNNFIIWRLYGVDEKENIDTYFLFGENNCRVSSFTITKTDKWDRLRKIEFLKNIFLNSEQNQEN